MSDENLDLDISATGDDADLINRLDAALYPDDNDGGTPADEGKPAAKDSDEDTLDEVLDSDKEVTDENDDGNNDGGDDDVSLATYLGLDDDQLQVDEESGKVTFNANIDGELKEVELPELVKSYQLEQFVHKKSEALSEERKVFETARDEQVGMINTHLESGEALAQFAAKQLMAEFDAIDMDALRAQNPAEWSAVQQEMQGRAQQIQNILGNIGVKRKEMMEAQQKEQMEKHQLFLKGQRDKLLEANPTWIDEKVREKDQGRIRKFVGEKYGFDDKEMNMVTDHRLMALIQDAEKYHNGKTAAKPNKDKKVPKYQKPGQGNKRSTVKARQVKQLKTNLRKSGSVNDAAAAIENRM